MTRTVTWNLLNLTGTVNTGNVRFKFTGSFTPDSQYVASDITVQSDAEGNGSAELFVNESGEIASTHICYLPTGESFSFTVPAGEGSITLSTLREAGAVEGSEQFNTVLTYINSIIDTTEYDTLPDPEGFAEGTIIFVNDPE